MSASSANTLISPSNHRGTAAPSVHRRPSVHSHHTTHAHHSVKRRASTHGHAGNRRSSEGEHGRRALVAGLAMNTLETAAASKPAPKKRNSGDRPLTKSSRSDTHLPRLSRTHSMTSVVSHTSSNSATGRPGKGGRKSSEETVQVLSEDGGQAGPSGGNAGEEEEEEEWEDGDEAPKPKPSSSAAMRRTVSDTSADPKGKQKRHSHHPSISAIIAEGNLVDTPLEAPNPLSSTQRTTGFAGSVQPPDPQVAAELPSVEHHPVITNPIKRVASTKSLVGPIMMESTSDLGAGTAFESPTEYKEEDHDHDAKAPPPGPARLRSTQGSGLPAENKEVSTSPSYPFPQMVLPSPPSTATTKPSAPVPPKEQDNTPPNSAPIQNHPRSRQTSNQNGHILRHRYSNSSLRSIQSLRAPPHPLNSPTGYRTGMHASRPGSNFGSPSKGGDRRERIPSMHQPPVPQPQVSYEVAQGHGWDEIPENEVFKRRTAPPAPAPPKSNGPTGPKPQSVRKSSVSSTHSIRNIFAGTLGTPSSSITPIAEPTTTAQSQSQRDGPPTPHRRLTAFEAASAASKRNTTTDPALYHHSLGHSTNSAETTFLVSRFLPVKKVHRPTWEIDLRDPEQVENPRVGLTNGDYRESHESLVRTFRELGVFNGAGNGTSTGGATQGKRGISRSYSGYNLLSGAGGTGGASNDHTDQGLGMIRARDGTGLLVSKGSSGGKTPFEMSVERCLAQRPGRVIV
ncbi:hypothetical protein CI109_101805 [Kwoniella shandongensis]|uniref:Uncharacterized protein n=1 Tax=Kwoniella shandongensis TaxID=1734106 RepID=A0A5M6C5J2_9TREE|nr:uncharacterized protein CI109_001073 [Kwoniella shandongensis]KAA5530273.1 hypothetical protein CI109_001073 [Kwoniella shandongensis]